MALSVTIKYKDATREPIDRPFCFQRVAQEFWWPIADRLNLPTLQRLECLFISDRAEAEQLVAELKTVERYLRESEQAIAPPDTAEYVLTRIGQVVRLVEQAIREWDQVAEITI
jgi:hypothetical protein